MKQILTLIFTLLSYNVFAQSVVVNPDGTNSIIIDNGSTKTIVNPNGTHSIIIDNGSTKTIVNPNGTYSIIIDNGSTKTIVNPNGTHSIIIDNGSTKTIVNPNRTRTKKIKKTTANIGLAKNRRTEFCRTTELIRLSSTTEAQRQL